VDPLAVRVARRRSWARCTAACRRGDARVAQPNGQRRYERDGRCRHCQPGRVAGIRGERRRARCRERELAAERSDRNTREGAALGSVGRLLEDPAAEGPLSVLPTPRGATTTTWRRKSCCPRPWSCSDRNHPTWQKRPPLQLTAFRPEPRIPGRRLRRPVPPLSPPTGEPRLSSQAKRTASWGWTIGFARAATSSRGRVGRLVVQPMNEWNAPNGWGSVGVKGLNLYGLLVSKPALPAAVLSANGVSAVTALPMFVHRSVRS
jgi:hypothetical protein